MSVSFLNAVDVGCDAQVKVNLGDTENIFHFRISHEAIFDFLRGDFEGRLSSAQALSKFWDRFEPAIDATIKRHGLKFEIMTTEMLNG